MLAFVIYYDKTGVLKNEKRWNTWKDSRIPTVELDNEPTEGFVLNKTVGGARQSYGWHSRNEYFRVYDPRGFEFEITTPNLLFILNHCGSDPGKGLSGEFVYGWDKMRLVLIPTSAAEYQTSKQYTELSGMTVNYSLVPGYTYITRDVETLTYIGNYDYHFAIKSLYYLDKFERKHLKKIGKRNVFWNGSKFVFIDDLKKIAKVVSDIPVANLAELIQGYYESINGSKAVRLFTKTVEDNTIRSGSTYGPLEVDSHGSTPYWARQEGDTFNLFKTHYNDGKVTTVILESNVSMKDGKVTMDTSVHEHGYYDATYGWKGHKKNKNWEQTEERLFVELESGSVFKFHDIPENYQNLASFTKEN